MKQVILIRHDLKLPKGKLAAQAAHASVEAALKSDYLNEWRLHGQAKIVLKVTDERMLVEYFQKAKDAGLSASLITDAGHTVVAPGTKTAVGIGPAEDDDIDLITANLPLL